jgi:hypothetical protein
MTLAAAYGGSGNRAEQRSAQSSMELSEVRINQTSPQQGATSARAFHDSEGPQPVHSMIVRDLSPCIP